MSGVRLGPITLRAFEVPEHIRFGGEQRLAIHRLPGGGRVVDAMGEDDGDITWSGMMLGADAADRARALDDLRRSGTTVPLVFGDMGYDVVLAQFQADYRRPSWIGEYHIRCMVIPAVTDGQDNLSSVLMNDLSASLALDPEDNLGLAASVMATQSALNGADPSSGPTELSNISTPLSGAAAQIDAIRTQAELAMEVAITKAENASGSVGGPFGLATITDTAGTLARAQTIQDLLLRALDNLSNGAV